MNGGIVPQAECDDATHILHIFDIGEGILEVLRALLVHFRTAHVGETELCEEYLLTVVAVGLHHFIRGIVGRNPRLVCSGRNLRGIGMPSHNIKIVIGVGRAFSKLAALYIIVDSLQEIGKISF